MKIDYGELQKLKLPNFFDEMHVRGSFKLGNVDIADFMKQNTDLYKIRKRNGKYREIYVPSIKLKYVQKWILQNILKKIEVSRHAHGFVEGKSIVTNARLHAKLGDRWCLSIDIENFFDSINISLINNIFINIGYSIPVSQIFSELCCFAGYLKQGFCTSPYLSNIVLNELDYSINELGINQYRDFDIVFTRYADDIIISGIRKKGYTKVINHFKREINTQLKRINLTVNDSKTKVQKKDIKKITGLYIKGEQIYVSRRYIKAIESDIYYCEKYGVMGHLDYHNMSSISNFKGYMYGRCFFLKMINKLEAQKLIKRLDGLNW